MGKNSTLYIVTTPIGNLGDLTARAVDIIKSVDLIACEDTRVVRKILSYLGVSKPMLSLYKCSEHKRAERVLSELKGGKSVAYLSDAGTPLVSDPGSHLVKRAHEEGIKVIPVPGPSAVVCALQASGFNADRFIFAGFLPRRGEERMRAIDEISRFSGAVVIFESPKRVVQTIDDLIAVLGSDTPAFLAREMTKIHEEYLFGALNYIRSQLGARGKIRGEVTLVIFIKPKAKKDTGYLPVRERASKLIRYGLSVKQAACVISDEMDISRSEAYKEVLKVYEPRRE